ncbi:hypothetical protein [Paraburkholderia bonniea]|uniref:hypothetical protein n=1 Tax=Paraburkholderia bonniea TaxID=2152891 RepID=UPI0012924425|nr:hypothetical protein [Paraburkholderia bonniea]
MKILLLRNRPPRHHPNSLNDKKAGLPDLPFSGQAARIYLPGLYFFGMIIAAMS